MNSIRHIELSEGKRSFAKRPRRIRVRRRVRSGNADARRRALKAVERYLNCPHGQRALAPQLAKQLDKSDPFTQHRGWAQMLSKASSRGEVMEALKHSTSEVGWRRLGLPPCLDARIGPASSGSLEHPESWLRLVRERLTQRLQPGSEDPRVEEYRRLYQAHRELQTGKHHGKVSEIALYFDMKELESNLLPEHLGHARKDVRSKLLGSRAEEELHSATRVRRFLGSLSAAPPSAREHRMFQELSQIAVQNPKELPFYASLLKQEIRRCPAGFRFRLKSDFRKALDRVARTHAKKLGGERVKDRSQDFQGLMNALVEPHFDSASGQNRELEHYRTGLTVNGYVRNYTYL